MNQVQKVKVIVLMQKKINTRKKGNDGNYWIVKQTKCGRKRWIKESLKKNNNLI